MPIDWKKFQDELDGLVDEAGDRTDKKLGEKVASISRLTSDEVKRMFPDSADVKRLSELMEIVKTSGDRNKKINRIVSNAEEFGGVILTLLTKFA